MISVIWVRLLYLVAAVLFITGLKQLQSPETARAGSFCVHCAITFSARKPTYTANETPFSKPRWLAPSQVWETAADTSRHSRIHKLLIDGSPHSRAKVS